jgi:hypothetical protein
MPFLAGCEVAAPCWSRQLGCCGFEVQQSWNRYEVAVEFIASIEVLNRRSPATSLRITNY